MSFDLSILGVEQNIPKVNFLEYTGVFEAPEKFGKTAFSALYPNAVLLAAEKGYMAQVVNKRDVNTWDDVVKFIDLLAKHRAQIGDSIQSIIMDTAEEMYALVPKYIVKRESINDKVAYKKLKDIPYGQGFPLVDEEFKTQIKRILGMGFTILYLTHSKVKTMKPKNAEPYDIYISTMPDRLAQIVYPACDYIMRGERRPIEIEEGVTEVKRVITVRGNDSGSTAGNRVYFDDDIIFDTEEEAMEKFQEKFREGIERNLRKKGITTSIEELEKRQKQEREAAIQKYIQQEEEPKEEARSVEEIQGQIKEILAELSDEIKKDKITPEFKKIMGTANFLNVKDVDKLNIALEFAKSQQS